MKNIYMLDFNLSSAKMCLETLDTGYDSASRELPYYRHRHNAFEVHFVTSGACTIRAGEETFPLREGELCLIGPGLFHSVKSCTEHFDRVCLLFQALSAPAEIQDRETEALLNALCSARVLRLPAGNMAEILFEIRSASLAYACKTGGAARFKPLMELFLIDLAQHIGSRAVTKDAGSWPENRRDFLIEEFFHDFLSCKNGDELLAKRLYVSTRQLHRILKKLYGKGFREKLMEARLEVAVDLLATTDESIEKISERLGYACNANFCTFIKRMTGKTPSVIRREGQKAAGAVRNEGGLKKDPGMLFKVRGKPLLRAR
jgi:AraC-like DNA-binding protein